MVTNRDRPRPAQAVHNGAGACHADPPDARKTRRHATYGHQDGDARRGLDHHSPRRPRPWGGHTSERELVLTQAPYLLAALKPYVVTQQLETGKKFLFSTFDPATLSQQVTTVVIEGRERIRVGDRMEPAIRLRQTFRGISVVSWVDGHGRTLKEESPAGLSLVRQDA